MKIRLTLPVQWSLSLLVGFILAYSYQPSHMTTRITKFNTNTPSSPVTPLTVSPAPFVTLPGGLLVRIKFFRENPPIFMDVLTLSEARIIAIPSGEYRIELVNRDGIVLFFQYFSVIFLEGSPPQPVDEKTVMFVLPLIDGAAKVVIYTPDGQVNYDILPK